MPLYNSGLGSFFKVDLINKRIRTYTLRILIIGPIIMHVILYTSEVNIPQVDVNSELPSIIKKAKFNNKKYEITGLLFYHNHYFVQILEGEKSHLEHLMAKLTLDPRHKNIERIVDEPLGHRYFEKWHMDSFNINNNEEIDPSALRLFKEVYSLNFSLKTDKLIDFYKAMLSSQSPF